MITFVFWSVVATSFCLAFAEGIRRPPVIMCDCPGDARFGLRPAAHMRSVGLFVHAVLDLGVAAGAVAMCAEGGWRTFDSIWIAVLALAAAYQWARWWRHSKLGRKRLLEKALGVVRETVAGLRVVPVPHGGAA